mmetsp:Transcript_36579/g.116420  ORF Transcript_36579/g.116420 Transcript_36579/m.116420 type:complete len:218 (+) Transcript_36579:1512-2165(+)
MAAEFLVHEGHLLLLEAQAWQALHELAELSRSDLALAAGHLFKELVHVLPELPRRAAQGLPCLPRRSLHHGQVGRTHRFCGSAQLPLRRRGACNELRELHPCLEEEVASRAREGLVGLQGSCDLGLGPCQCLQGVVSCGLDALELCDAGLLRPSEIGALHDLLRLLLGLPHDVGALLDRLLCKGLALGLMQLLQVLPSLGEDCSFGGGGALLQRVHL